MKKIIEGFLVYFLKTALWFRYSFEIKGLEKLNKQTLNKPGGVIFLPNHPTVFVDATAVTISLWPKYPIRPLIVEYMYYLPIVNTIMHMLNALPVPNFSETSNSFKKKKNEKAIEEVIKGLHKKENFLIFPAGRVKRAAYEAIDGASAIHRILQEAPDTNLVLVRVKGLWGSSFSRALTGKTPAMFPTMMKGVGYVLKNLMLFTPRRKVILEFEPMPADFPRSAGRLEMNKYMEQWLNKPDNLIPEQKPVQGDSLILISYSAWKEQLPKISATAPLGDERIKVADIPPTVQEKVKAKIAELLTIDPKTIQPNMSLTADLGMDSLDVAEVIAFLQDQFDITNVSPGDLTSVAKVMALATRQVEAEGSKEEETADIRKWKKPHVHQRALIAPGNTIPESFLNNCNRMGSAAACADMRSGVVTYSDLKLRTLILAEHIKTLPGKYVGILLPASVTATMTVVACQLAGKVPLMVNWTVGPRHLQNIAELSNVQVVLSAWSFLDRLQNVDFNGIDDKIVMLEDIRRDMGLMPKIKGMFRSKLSTQKILKLFKKEGLKPEDEAVLLFTSGTESMPKGVPLTHSNIMNNLRASLEAIEVYTDDIIFGILPPFHSFGFTISSLAGILSGVRIAFSPDPTDGKRLAQAFSYWGVTIMCAAPTFVKGMLKAATKDQLKTMRLCITGAEQMPPELEKAMEQMGRKDSLYEGYGITECSPVLTFTPLGKPRKGVGIPIHNVTLLIVDLVSHQPLPQGQQGLILAHGPNIFSGYLNPGLASPFLTIEGKQWYNTGDLGYIDAEGNLILSGRLKRFVKVGGEMISLTAIETALSHAAIHKNWVQPEEGPILALVGKEIPGEKPRLSLFSKFSISQDEVNAALREAGFSSLVKVTSVKQLSEIPIMGTGKVNYRKLEELEAQQPISAIVRKE